MNYHILTDYGFTEPEVTVFQILLESGESNVTDILSHTTLSRTSVHDALGNLLGRDMLDYRKEGRNAYYKAVHPNKLYALLEEKKQATSRLNAEMEEVIRGMVGSYNLSESKPGVRFFEGVEGIKEVLFESLQAKETIYTFVNSRIVNTYAKQLDDEYVHERTKRGIQKKIIMSDTPEARDYIKHMDKSLTEVRLIDETQYPYELAVEIYNDSVAFLTAQTNRMSAFLLNDPIVAQFHKTMFLFVWNHLDPQA